MSSADALEAIRPAVKRPIREWTERIWPAPAEVARLSQGERVAAGEGARLRADEFRKPGQTKGSSMAKRGRPRKIKQREPNGRVQRAGPRGPKRDEGTRQLRRLRAWFAQGGNPELTAYPLGILLANDQITEAQHRAACRYAWLHAMVFGRPSIAAAAWERQDPSVEPEVDEQREKWLAALERQLHSVSELLRAQPALLRSALHGLVISERIPRFMQPVFPRPSDSHEAELLREALVLLERHFGSAPAKAA